MLLMNSSILYNHHAPIASQFRLKAKLHQARKPSYKIPLFSIGKKLIVKYGYLLSKNVFISLLFFFDC